MNNKLEILINKTLSGCPTATSQLYQLIQIFIFKQINRKLNKPLFEKEELSHKIATKIILKLDQFNPHKGEFEGWVSTIVKNDLITLFRRAPEKTESLYTYNQEGKEMGINIESDQYADSSISKKELNSILKTEMDRILTEAEKQIIKLYYFEGMKSKEIAQFLNWKLSTTKTNLYRAKLKLKDSLQLKALLY